MNRMELQELYEKALDFSEMENANASTCAWVYRNQWPEYFENILHNEDGLMKVVPKDRSGDPRSPINGGKISGLFFMANNYDGQPSRCSPFGPCRLQCPPNVLLDVASNVYFADFYCMQGYTHYVTLVLARPGSWVNAFCRRRLLELPLNNEYNNPFLFLRNGLIHTLGGRHLMVIKFCYH